MTASDLLVCLHDCIGLVGDNVTVVFVTENGVRHRINSVDVIDEFKEYPKIELAS